MSAIADVLRFFLELGGIAAAAYAGWNAGGDGPLRLVLAIGAPAVLIVVWGRFVSPRSGGPLSPTGKTIVGGALLLVTAAGLLAVGQQPLALAFAALIVVDTIALLAVAR